ncbi:MAG: 2-hydroxychromene-2-carboxylate isomerase [Pseudomonadota bacterium]
MRIELFYDVGSTNSYFALHLLDRLANRYGAELIYQPFNLGYVFRHHNYVLMDEPPAKLKNRRRDLMRWAERHELPFRMPEQFPIKTSPALRGALAARRLGRERNYLFEVFARYWERNDASIADYPGVIAAAQAAGCDGASFEELVRGDGIGDELRAATQSALDREIFGAPSIVIGDELFWGKDRMEFVEDELRRLTAD